MTTFRHVHTIYINNLASTVNTDYAQFEVYTFMVTTSIILLCK